MKLSYKKLQELLPDLSLSPRDLQEFMTQNFAENDPCVSIKGKFSDVEIAEIAEISPHPDAEKLKLVRAKTFDGELGDIVTGSEILEVGQKVALVREDGYIPGGFGAEGFRVSAREMRGVLSKNVLLSEKELGIGLDHLVVMALPKDSAVGKFTEVFPEFSDTQMIIDNKALSNRSDCFSHLGVARELSALLKIPLNFSIPEASLSGKNPSCTFGEFADEVMEYTILEIEVANAKSLMDHRAFLVAAGIRPISRIVDISNITMDMLGQPQHMFDADKIEKIAGKNPEFGVRRAKNGEKLITLDGKERDLHEEDLVIIANNIPITLAGVMGGLSTEAESATKRIFIESARFDSVSIRRTAKRHNLKSDASQRFEHGIDPEITKLAQYFSVDLLMKYAEGRNPSSILSYRKKGSERGKVTLPKKYASQYAGYEISPELAKSHLERMQCEVAENEDSFQVFPPSWRLDLSIPEDLVEDIHRAHGIENIEERPFSGNIVPPSKNGMRALEKDLIHTLCEIGFDEVYSHSFAEEEKILLAGWEVENCIEILESPAPEVRNLRPSLVPNLLSVVQKNRGFFDSIKIFEIGKVFQSPETHGVVPAEVGKEKKRIALVIAGKDHVETLFRSIRGVQKVLSGQFTIDEKKIVKASRVQFFEGSDLKLKGMAVISLEIDLEFLVSLREERKYIQPHEFPIVERDITLTIEENTRIGSIAKGIEKRISSLEHDFKVKFLPYDIFRHSSGKNITFKFFFSSEERTLQSSEVDIFIKKTSEIS